MREENPRPPSDEGFHLRGGKQKPKPPSDEGGGPKGRRERFRCMILPALRKNGTGVSPPVSFADSPLVRGGQGGSVQKPASSERAKGLSTPVEESGNASLPLMREVAKIEDF